MAIMNGSPRMWPLFLRAGAEIGINNTDPYIRVVRVRNDGGFKKYEQAHLATLTATFAPKLRLPVRPARLVAEYWGHAGFY